jgi:hypothetical protein
MRRIVSWLLVASLSFVLGVAANVVWLRHRAAQGTVIALSSQSQQSDSSATLPILSLCELVNNPEKYSGHVVRVSTTLSGFIHGSFVYDPNCVRVDTGTAVFFNAEHKDQIQSDLKQARDSDNFLEPVNMIAVGKFRKVVPSNESDTIYDTASLQFEIVRIESASKVR